MMVKEKGKQKSRASDDKRRNNIQVTLTMKCCEKKCLTKTSEDALMAIRAPMKSMTIPEQSTHILRLYMSQGEKTIIDGRQFCVKGFCAALSISKGRFYNIKSQKNNENLEIIHKNTNSSCLSAESEVFNCYVQDWMQNFCDQMPNKEEYHAPVGYTKQQLFQDYNSLFEDFKVSESTAYRLLVNTLKISYSQSAKDSQNATFVAN